MKLRQIPISAAQLAAIPVQERALAVVLGHAMNEVNVLIKLFDLASTFEMEPRAFGNAHVCQAMVLARTITGKLHEIWATLQEGYFKSKLTQTYDSRLDEVGLAGLKHLKAYFGQTNTISVTRNNFAFHFSLERAAHVVPGEVPTEDLSIYIGPNNASSLYQFAEYTMGSSLIDAIDRDDGPSAFQKLIDETGKATTAFIDFAQRLLYSILERHGALPEGLESLITIDIGNVPRKADLCIPYFYE